ncbi:MAG: polymerase III, beta subunit protein [Candidatus Azambacteria bacterium GW2011_GWE1_42_9]|nr:MAG: polymerase III, beta subunit protein [Candidatus Azambacteria bacterium GW2011_GWF1_41_10]KKS49393.1 MAG: polymerase III, beta subunit protein [Candidatus Azambacteria bacterium GW2011_GWF2_42_22]KKS69059.1 MAG: polymerase III, beta subunit protein [Candidatus Azambacteria bacterium GW2011_GWA2_42_62]KKS74315.1 MAG: polymerase III, beta subunit protein [Candidatus Azambacteria bacterium GW2011_GWB1_42_72]KKS79575.1 MAG: polymerase III, beta subunit protein [Candidatus Azambacteria bacte
MNVICTKENLKEVVDNALRIVKHNSSLPILNNFLLIADKGRFEISSTDLEIGFTSFVSSKIIKDGGITVPAQLFNQFINNLPSKNIGLEVKNQKLQISCDNIAATINGLGVEDFPIIPKVKNTATLNIDSKILKDAFLSVVGAAALSNARPEISSVYLKMEPNILKFISTDSFRLAHKTLFLSSDELKEKIKIDYPKSHNIIIPLRTVGEIIRILSDKNTNITIGIDENQIVFNVGDAKLISRLINGNYPDYEAIIPKSFETQCFTSKNELEEAVKLSGCFSSRLNEVSIKTSGGKSHMEVSSGDSEIGEHKARIDSEIKGGDIAATFNWHYLLDGLKSISGDDIIFEFNGDQKPAMIRPASGSDFFYIIMPIRNV